MRKKIMGGEPSFCTESVLMELNNGCVIKL